MDKRTMPCAFMKCVLVLQATPWNRAALEKIIVPKALFNFS
jgi:hypothetical protein